MLSDALVALHAYDQPPSDADLAVAEAREGAGLSARLANALYGCALAHVMSAAVIAAASPTSTGYRAAAWQATGGNPEGAAILLHYASMRLAADLQVIHRQRPLDLGVMGAAAGAAQALALLLEITTVRSLDDPRAEQVTTNLARAQDELAVAHQRLVDLFAAGRAAAVIQGTQGPAS